MGFAPRKEIFAIVSFLSLLTNKVIILKLFNDAALTVYLINIQT
jgi:hypothetical protein